MKDRVLKRRQDILRNALLVLLCGALLLGSAPTQARRSKGKDKGATAQVEQLLGQARTAIAAKDAATARQALTESLRVSPTSDALYLLGGLALEAGRTVQAQDLMRRYLHETAGETEGPTQKEAQRVLTLPAGPAGEISVLGSRGALVFIDEQLSGALPLSLPLLLPTGLHKVAVDVSGQRVEEQVKVLPGQLAELRVNQKTGVVVVSSPPALILITAGMAAPDAQKLAQTLSPAAKKERMAVVSTEQAVSLKPALAGCLAEPRCQVELGTLNEAQYLLFVQVQPGPPGTPGQVRLRIVDPSVGEVAAESVAACQSCGGDPLAQVAAGSLAGLLTQAAARQRGTVEITSDPDGAEVLIDGQPVGRTPYRGQRYAGSHIVELHREGAPTYRTTLSVEPEKKNQLTASLLKPDEREPPPPPLDLTRPTPPPQQQRFELRRQPRPVWRLVLGSVLIGGGLLTAGFGVSAFTVNSQCDLDPDPFDYPCAQRYNTATVAPALVGSGAGLLAIGAVLIAVPGPQKRVQVAAAGRADSFALSLSF